MSADNWTICPKCQNNSQSYLAEMESKLNASYGKVPSMTWKAEWNKFSISKQSVTKPTDTLREDYEIGMLQDGSFYCSYGCSCQECGFSFAFKKEISANDILKTQPTKQQE